MARARKVHKQLSLLPTLDKNGQRRGGKRKGAGRPPAGPRSSEPHKRRTVFKGRHPLHVTIRAIKAVGSLRGFEVHRAVRKAMVTTYAKALIRIVHLSIQATHIHLIVEANSRKSLARGMQGFEIACAKLINAAITKRTGCKRRGTVFPDRYHVEIITTPTQARNALSYVLRGSSRIRCERNEHARWSFRCAPGETALLRSAMSPRVMRPFAWAFASHAPAHEPSTRNSTIPEDAASG